MMSERYVIRQAAAEAGVKLGRCVDCDMATIRVDPRKALKGRKGRKVRQVRVYCAVVGRLDVCPIVCTSWVQAQD